jgi:hypothetical protein
VKLPFGPGRLLVAIIKPFCFQKLTFYTPQNAHHKLTTAPCAQEAHRPGGLGGGRASILGEDGCDERRAGLCDDSMQTWLHDFVLVLETDFLGWVALFSLGLKSPS